MAFARRHPALSSFIVAAAMVSFAAAARGQDGAPSAAAPAAPADSASGASPFGALDLSIAPSEGRSSDENRPAAPSPAPVIPAAPESGVALPPEARSVSPGPAPTPVRITPPPPAIDHEQARALTTRAHNAMANGDIAGARALLTAAGRDPEAERMLAEAWDPDVLARLGVVGIEGDAGKARALYDRAAADAGTPPKAQ